MLIYDTHSAQHGANYAKKALVSPSQIQIAEAQVAILDFLGAAIDCPHFF